MNVLKLYDNPIENIEIELLGGEGGGNCLDLIKDYFNGLEKSGYETNEQVKVLLLGNGRSGKTSIVKSLFNEEFNENEKSTHAVTQRILKLPTDEYPGLKIQFWDFGGQDIYFGTHRLFMKHKTLYLLVWDNESENSLYHYDDNGEKFRNYQLPYWLDYINTFSPRSPVILVRNKADDNLKQQYLHYEELKRKYKIVDYIDYSAKNRQRRTEFIEMLKRRIEMMPQLGRKIPKAWYNVRKKIQEIASLEEKEYIEYEVYHNLCKDEKIHEITLTSEKSLLEYLHATGVLFYDKEIFADRIILDQKWAIEAINTLFDRDKCYDKLKNRTKGVFTKKQLAKMAWDRLSSEKQDLCLKFMEACHLCFPMEESAKNGEQYYVAPQLLDKVPDYYKDGQSQQKVEGINFIYEYQYFHIGIFHRFISRISKRIKDKKLAGFFEDSIELTNINTRSRAIIEYETDESVEYSTTGKILINVRGKNRAGFLHEIIKDFEGLNENASVTEVVSLDMVDFIGLNNLKKHKEKGFDKVLSREGNLVLIKGLNEFLEVPKEENELSDKNSKISTERELTQEKDLKLYRHDIGKGSGTETGKAEAAIIETNTKNNINMLEKHYQERINELDRQLKQQFEILKGYEKEFETAEDTRKIISIERNIERTKGDIDRIEKEVKEVFVKINDIPDNTVETIRIDESLKMVHVQLADLKDTTEKGIERLSSEMSEMQNNLLQHYDTSVRNIVMPEIKKLQDGQLDIIECLFEDLELNKMKLFVEENNQLMHDFLNTVKEEVEKSENENKSKILKVLNSTKDEITSKFKLTLPIIPGLFKYEAEYAMKAEFGFLTFIKRFLEKRGKRKK